MFVSTQDTKKCILKIEKLFKNLEDDVFDEYNNGNISKDEMVNIIAWCEKIKKSKTTELKGENEK